MQGALEMASGKGAGIAKSTILVLLWGSPKFRRPWKREIQEIQGALEMATGKGAGIAKSTILVLLWCSPPSSAALEAGNPRNTRDLGNGFRKRSGYCKIDNFGAFHFPPISAAMEAGNPEIQGALEMAFGKGAGIAKSTILVLLWCSPQFGGFGSRKSKKYKGPWKFRKRAGIAKSTFLVLLCCSTHFGGLGSQKSRKSNRP